MLLVANCKQASNSKNDNIIVINTALADVETPKIKWVDSANVAISLDSNILFDNSRTQFDSVDIVHYWGYGVDSEIGYYPVNEKGQWISTIIKSKRLDREYTAWIDSLLASFENFDSPDAEPINLPKFGLIYYKNGAVVGLVSIGDKSVMSTIKLGNHTYFAVFKEQTFQRIRSLLNRELGYY